MVPGAQPAQEGRVNAPREVYVPLDCGIHEGPAKLDRACARCQRARERIARELAETEPYYERVKRGDGVAWGDR
jgi:DNA-binding SARP family transcriptional activator